MPSKPEDFDYEGVFRRGRGGRSGLGRDSDAPADDMWAKSGKLKSFNDDQFVPAPAGAPVSAVASVSAPVIEQERSDASFVSRSASWIRRRGHTLSFIGLFIFSVILFVRPYELFPALSGFKQMAFYTGLVTLIIYAATQIALEGNLTARPKEINLALLIGAFALLSMPLADDPAGAWETFNDMLLKTLVIFIVIVNVVRTELRMKMLIWLVLGVSIFLSISAIQDYRSGAFETASADSQFLRVGGRIGGLFGNSNDLALHLVTMIPIAVGLGLSGRNPFKRLAYFGLTGLMVAGVVVTFSRGGFIGLVAATFMLVRRLGKKNRVTTTGALVFAVILFVVFAPGGFSSRLGTIFNSAADLTGSSSQRTEVLKRSVWVALRYPIFGVGIGNFRHKSPRNLETHNAYTQVAAELGLTAMVVYILFLVHPLRRLRLIENESYEQRDRRKFYYLSVALQASLIGFMFSSFFGAVAYQWYVYYLVGYAVCLHRLYLLQFPPEDEFARNRWEQPFSKKTRKLIGGETAPAPSQA